MYNLISDVVGGVELIVLEETYVVPAASTTPPAPVRPAVHSQTNSGNGDTKTEPVAVVPENG